MISICWLRAVRPRVSLRAFTRLVTCSFGRLQRYRSGLMMTLYRHMMIGSWMRSGRQPPAGLNFSSWYIAISSSCIFCWVALSSRPAYFLRIAFVFGAREACLIWFFCCLMAIGRSKISMTKAKSRIANR